MKRALFTITILLSSIIIKADEGMWIPSLLKELNIDDMKANGLKLSAEEIYSVNNSSHKRCYCLFWRFLYWGNYFK